VNYDTPRFGGFSASAQYTTLQVARNNAGTTTASNNAIPTAKGRKMSFSGQYAAGPMAIVAAYSKHDDDQANTAVNGREDTAYLIGGTYQIGPVKLGLTYIDAEIETGVGATTERKSWNIAADWKLSGPHSIKVGYADAGDAKTSAGGGANTGAKLFQIGYGHALSKRTSASLTYARMSNDSAGTYMFTGHSGTPRAGDDSSVIVLGLVHTF
jgi:predicted porin